MASPIDLIEVRNEPLDWPGVLREDPEDIIQNPDKFPQVYDDLCEKFWSWNIYSDDDQLTKDNLIRLFRISQVLLEGGQKMYNQVNDEREALEADLAESEADIKRLEEDLAEAEAEIDKFKNFDSKLSELEQKIRDKENELKTSDTHLKEAQDEKSQVEKDLEREKLTVKEKEDEIMRLDEKVRAKEQELRTVNLNLQTSKRAEDRFKKTSDEYKQNLSTTQKELEQLANEKKKLASDLEQAKKDIRGLNLQVQKLSADKQGQRAQVQDTEGQLFQLREENESLERKVQLLEDELENQERLALEKFEEYVSEAKTLLREKGQELATKQNEVDGLRDELTKIKNEILKLTKTTDGKERDMNRKIGELTSAVQLRDQEIGDLREQIKILRAKQKEQREQRAPRGGGAAGDQMPARPESSMSARSSDLDHTVRAQTPEQPQQQQQPVIDAARLEELRSNLRKEVASKEMLSADLAKAHAEILSLRAKMAKYEQGTYGLKDAHAEIRALEGQIDVMDKKERELIEQANELHSQLDQAQTMTEYLKSRLTPDQLAKMKDGVAGYKSRATIELEQARAMVAHYEEEIQVLEADCLRWRHQARLVAIGQGERAVQLGLTAEQVTKLDKLAELLKADVDIPELAFLDDPKFSMESALAQSGRGGRSRNAEVDRLRSELSIAQQLISDLRSREKFVDIIDDGKKTLAQQLKDTQDELRKQNAKITELQEKQLQARADVSIRASSANLEDIFKLLREGGDLSSFQTMLSTARQEAADKGQEITRLRDTIARLESQLRESESQMDQLQDGYLKKKLDEARKEADDKHKECQELAHTIKLHVIEVEELRKTLALIEAGGDEQKKGMADRAKKLIQLRFLEEQLNRRFQIMSETEAQLRRDNERLRVENVEIERDLRSKIAVLEAQTAVLEQHSSSLRESALRQVDRRMYESCKQELDRLSNLLAQHTAQQQHAESVQTTIRTLATRCESLELEKQQMSGKLAALETKCHKFEEILQSGGKGTESEVKLVSIQAALAQAEHTANTSQKRMELAQSEQRELEHRVQELQQQVIDLTTELRTPKISAPSLPIVDPSEPESTESPTILKQQVENLKSQLASAQAECQKNKNLLDIQGRDVSLARAFDERHEVEKQLLTKTIEDLQKKGEEQALIGKLNFELMQLRIAEVELKQERDRLLYDYRKFSSENLKLEQRILARNGDLSRMFRDFLSVFVSLEQTCTSLRSQLGSSLPATKAHDMLTTIEKSKSEARRAVEERSEWERRAQQAEREVEGLRVKCGEIQAAFDSASQRRGDDERHRLVQKASDLKMSEVKLQREVADRARKEEMLQMSLRQKEDEILMLEQKFVRSQEEFEANHASQVKRLIDYLKKLASIGGSELQQERDGDDDSGDYMFSAQDTNQVRSGAPSRMKSKSEKVGFTAAESSNNDEDEMNFGAVSAKVVRGGNSGRSLESKYGLLSANLSSEAPLAAVSSSLQTELDSLSEKVKALEREIEERDLRIDELNMKLIAAESSTTEQESGAVAGERQKNVDRVMQKRMEDLEALLKQKDEAAQRYQDMLRKARDLHAAEKLESNKRIEDLTQRLMTAEEEKVERLKEQARQIVREKDSPGMVMMMGPGGSVGVSLTPAGFMPMVEVDTLLLNKDRRISELGIQAETLKNALDSAQSTLEGKMFEIQDLTMRITQIQNERRRVESERDQILGKLRSLETQFFALQTKTESLQMDLQDSQKREEDARKVAEKVHFTAKEKLQKQKDEMLALLQQISELKEQLSVKEKQQENLKKAIAQLKKDLIQAAEISALKETEEKRNAVLEQAHTATQSHVSKLTSELLNLQQQYESTKRELAILCDREEKVCEDLRDRTSDIQRFKEEARRWQSECEDKERECERVQGEMSKVESEMKGLRDEITRLNSEMRRYQRLAKDAQTREKRAQEDLEALKAVSVKMKEGVVSSRTVTYVERGRSGGGGGGASSARALSPAPSVDSDEELFKVETKKGQKAGNPRAAQVSPRQPSPSIAKRPPAPAATGTSLLDELRVEKLEKQLNDATHENTKLFSEKTIAERQRQQMETERDDLNRRLADAQKEIVRLRQSLETAKSDRSSAERDVERYKKLLDTEKQSGQSVQAQVDKLTRDLTQCRDDLATERRERQTECDRLKEVHKKNMSKSETERGEVEERLKKNLQTHKLESEKKIKELSDSLRTCDAKIRRLTEDISEKDDYIKTLESQKQRLIESANPSAATVWETEKKLRKQVEALRAKLLSQSKQSDDSVKIVEDLRTANEAMSKERNELVNRLHRTENELAELQRKVQHDFAALPSAAELRSQVNQLQEQNSTLQKALTVDKEIELRSLKHELSKAQTALKNTQKELSEFRGDSLPCRDGEISRAAPSLGTQDDLEDRLLKAENANIELRFEVESSRTSIGRLQYRIRELEVLQLIAQERGGGGGSGVSPRDFKIAVPATSGGKKQSTHELEDVITSMRKVIEKLQSEKESLQKNAQSSVKYMEVVKENKVLKQKCADLEIEAKRLAEKLAGQEDVGRNTTKLAEVNAQLQKKLKTEKESVEKARDEVRELTIAKVQLEKRVEELESRVQTKERSNEATAMRVRLVAESDTAEAQDKSRRLAADLERKTALLLDMKEELQKAMEENELLHSEIGEKDAKIRELEDSFRRKSRDGGGLGLADSRGEIPFLRDRIRELESERERLTKQLRAAANAGRVDDLYKALEDSLAALKEENALLRKENSDLKSELDAFDPAFFEEIEDLKFSYHEAVKLNIAYEERLRDLSDEYGFSFEPIKPG